MGNYEKPPDRLETPTLMKRSAANVCVCMGETSGTRVQWLPGGVLKIKNCESKGRGTREQEEKD